MLTPTQIRQFDESGYILVPDILLDDPLSQIRSVAQDMGAREPHRNSWNERSCFRRPHFLRMFDAPLLIGVAEALIGQDMQLLQFDLLRTRSDDAEPEWHRDTDFSCNKTLAISMAIYLQDTPVGAGPLMVVPGSHRRDEGPPTLHGNLPDQVPVPVKRGAAIIHDSALWHRASLDGPGIDCWALFPIFGRFWMKRRDVDCLQPPPATVLALTAPLQRQLFGFNLRDHAPTFLGGGEQYNRRGDAGVDFLPLQ